MEPIKQIHYDTAVNNLDYMEKSFMLIFPDELPNVLVSKTKEDFRSMLKCIFKFGQNEQIDEVLREEMIIYLTRNLKN
jgi:hypothetical protein